MLHAIPGIVSVTKAVDQALKTRKMLSCGQVSCLITFYKGARTWPRNPQMVIIPTTPGRNEAQAELSSQLLSSSIFNYKTKKIIASHATKKKLSPKHLQKTNCRCSCWGFLITNKALLCVQATLGISILELWVQVQSDSTYWTEPQTYRTARRSCTHNKSDTLKTVVENLSANVKLQTYASVFAELPLEKKLS